MNSQVRDVLAHLERQLAEAADPAAKAEILASMGRLYEEGLGQQDQALFHYKRALDYHPHSEKALDGEARILAAQNRHAELEEVLRQSLGLAGGRQRRAALEFQLARLYLDHLHNDVLATAALVRVLDLDPMHRGVYPLLDELYRKAGQWHAAYDNLSAWLDLTQDKATAVDLMNRMAAISLQHLDDAEKAQHILEEVLLIDAENGAALQLLEGVYRKSQSWEALAAVLHRQASLLVFRHPQEQLRIGLELADLYTQHIPKNDQAEIVLRKVLDLDPSHPRARELLAQLLEAKANWVEVLQTYRADLEYIKEPQAKAQKILQMAELTEFKLARGSEATPLYAEAHAILQDDAKGVGEDLVDKITKHLVRRWTEERRTKDLLLFFRERVKRTRSLLEKAEALQQLAQLTDDAEAGEYCQALLDLCPDLGLDYQNHFKKFALKKLAPLLVKQERWHALIANYREQLTLAHEPPDRAMLYFRIAEIQNQKLNALEDASEAYGKALDLNPALSPAMRARRDVLTQLGHYHEAISLFQMEISLTQGARAKSALYFQLGRLREEHLKQGELAVRDYEQALELDPDNHEAIKRLAVYFYQNEDWQKADPLFERLSLSDEAIEGLDPLKKAAFWARRARIAENLDHLEEATKFLYRALEFDPNFVPALEQLADLYQRTHQWQEARRYYNDFIRVVADGPAPSPESMANIHLNLARIEERLGNMDDAVKNYRRVLAIEPVHRQALEALINLDAAANRWSEVQQHYDGLLRLDPGPEDWMTIQFAKAEIWEQRLEKPKNAVACYQAVLERDPLNHLAQERLAQLYCASGELEKGTAMLEQLMRGEPDSGRRVQYLHSLGRIHRLGTKNLEAAAEQFRQILLIDPNNIAAMKELVEVLQAQASWAELGGVYGKIVNLVSQSDPLMAIPFYLKQGLLYRRELNQPEAAIAAYKKVLEIDEDNVAARNALVELYAAHESFHDEAIRHHRKLLETDPFRMASYRALAQIFLQRREIDRAYCLFKIIDVVGESTPDERSLVIKCQSALPVTLRSEVQEGLRKDVLTHPSEKALISDMLRAFCDTLRELFWDERTLEKCEEPIGPFARQMSECIAQVSPVLGIQAPLLRVLRSAEDRLLPMAGAQSYLIAYGGFLRGAFAAPERFRVVRVLDSLVGGREFAWRLGPTQLERLFIVILKSFFKDLSVGGYPEKDLKADLKHFESVFSRKLRSALKDLVIQVARAWDQLDFNSWLQGVRLTGNRTALLITGDLDAAMQVVMEDERLEAMFAKRDGAGLNRLGVFMRSAALKDLLVFAASDDYARLRLRLGKAIPPGRVQV